MGFGIAVGLTVLTVFLVVGLLAVRAAGRPWRVPLIAMMLALPLHPLSLFLVRLPLHQWLTTLLSPDALFWVSSLYAPLLEEPPKWIVLIALFFSGQVTTKNAIGVALAIGVGFGLGEIGTLATSIVLHQPDQLDYPFYLYTGFFIERLFVCFLHGAFVVPLAVALTQKRLVIPAALAGLVLHYLTNLPPMFATMRAFGQPPETWIGLALPWLVILTAALAAMIGVLLRKQGKSSLLGDTPCQACGEPIARSLIALNLGPWKFQRCPHCGKWQFI